MPLNFVQFLSTFLSTLNEYPIAVPRISGTHLKFAVLKTSFIAFFLMATGAFAQTGGLYSLQGAIDLAIKNSIDVRLAEINTEQAEISYKQSKLNVTPDASLTAGQFFQSGRSIDRFTNQFVQTTVRSNNFQLQSSALLFGGGQIRQGIQQSKYLWLASESDLKNVSQNVALNVANLFLQVLQARELANSARQTLANTVLQLERTSKLFEAGVVNEGQVLNLKAQKASDELTLTNAENQENLALANLKMLLRLPSDTPFDIVAPVVSANKPEIYPYSLYELYDSALARRPDIKSSELRYTAAKYGKKVALGGLMPTLSVGGNVSTVYSSNAKFVSGTVFSGFQPIGRVQGSNDIVEAPDFEYTLQTIAFNKQIKDNFGQSLGFNLSYPVYGKLRNQTNYKLSRLDEERARLNAERSRQNLYNEVVGAYNNFAAAEKRYTSAIEATDAQKKNAEFVQKRFDAGQSNVYELQLARTTEANAKLNLASVKYEYIFRRMILDFYMGKELKL
jgi:outer membrane protein